MRNCLIPSTRFRAAAALFVLLAAAYTFSVPLRATRAASITGDEPFYLLTTQSLLDDGDLDLRQQYERASYRSFFDRRDGLWRQSIVLDDGRILSPHEPGTSVLVIPGFAVAGLRGVQVELLLIAALTFALSFVLTSLVTGRLGLSWLVTAGVGLCATPFVYATEVYPEVPAAFCLVVALLILQTGAKGLRAGLAIALTLTALMWLGEKYAPLAALAGIVFLYGADAKGRWAVVALGAVSAAFYVWFHYATFDHLTAYSVNTVYEGANAVSVLEAHVSVSDRVYRLWGLLIDRRFGVGRWAPLLLLLPASLPLLLRYGRVGRLALALIGTQVLIATFMAITMMGWWFPGRTLMTVLPLVPLALTALVARCGAPWRWAAAGLGIVSAAFTLGLQQAASAREVALAVDPWEMGWAPFRLVAHLFPNYQRWTLETNLLTLVWLVLLAVSTGLVVRREYGRELTSLLRARPRGFVRAGVPSLRGG